VPKSRVGKYKVAVEGFVKDLLERGGGAKDSGGNRGVSGDGVSRFRDFRDFSEDKIKGEK